MSFQEKYQLVKSLPGEAVESFRARQIRDGRDVTAHLLPGGRTSEPTRALMNRLVKLPPASMAKLLEIGEIQGKSFVVIAAPPFLHFHDWLRQEELTAASGAAAAVPAPGPGPAEPPVGEFTRLFSATPEQPPPVPAKEPHPPTAAGSSQPGEFTLLFSAAPPAAPPSSQPGEFTQLFQAAPSPPIPAAPPPPAPPAPSEWGSPAPPASGPGEFTKLFHAGPPAGTLPKDFGQPKPSPAAGFAWDQPPARSSGSGEFTQRFQTAPPASPALQNPLGAGRPAAPEPDNGEFTRIFGRPGAASAAPPAAPPAAAPPAAAQPGEYTRMMSPPPATPPPAPAFAPMDMPQAPAFPQAPPPPAMPAPPPMPAPAPIAAPPAAPAPNFLLLAIVGLGGFLIGVVVTFLLLRK